MKAFRFLLALIALSLFCSISSPTVKADEWDKKTFVTFSGPVEISGHRLEAGTYVFKLADSAADRHIVQIFNADETHVYATILAIPDWRVIPRGKTVIKFSEKAGEVATMDRNLPEAGIPVKEWFYPGDNFGQEFLVKPARVEVAETAKTESTPVPVVEEKPAPAVEEKTEIAEVQPAPVAQPEVTQPAQTEAPAETPKELPQTASPMPLIGLVGLVSLGAALSLQQITKRMV